MDETQDFWKAVSEIQNAMICDILRSAKAKGTDMSVDELRVKALELAINVVNAQSMPCEDAVKLADLYFSFLLGMNPFAPVALGSKD